MAEYTLNILDDTKTVGEFKYSITPDYSRGVAPGETVRILGTARWTQDGIKAIMYRVWSDAGKVSPGYDDCTANVSIAKGATGKFDLSVRISDEVFDTFSGRVCKAGLEGSKVWSELIVCDNRTGWGDNAHAKDTRLVLLKYRLEPTVTALSFRRSNASGGQANDGKYLLCESLKLTLNGKAAQADVSQKTVAITRVDTGAVVKTVTLTDAQLKSMLSASGYTETKPTLFSGVTLELGYEYDVTVTIGDAYDQVARVLRISRANAVVDFNPNGFSVGQFSTATAKQPKFEVAPTHEAHLYGKTFAAGGIEGVTNYASGETATGGHWIDGKPIYRYVWTGTITATGTVLLTNALTPTLISTLLSVRGGFRRSNNTLFPISTIDPSNAARGVGAIINSTGLNLFVGTAFSGSSPVVIIVDYTKATASDPPLPGPSAADDPPYADEGVARADYIAMMTGVEIPTEASAQSDPQAVDGPSLDGEPARSAHYAAVKLYYDAFPRRWNERMVRQAVGKWITAGEAEEILNNADNPKGA